MCAASLLDIAARGRGDRAGCRGRRDRGRRHRSLGRCHRQRRERGRGRSRRRDGPAAGSAAGPAGGRAGAGAPAHARSSTSGPRCSPSATGSPARSTTSSRTPSARLSVQMEALGSLVDDGADAAEIGAVAARSRRLVSEGLEETRRAVRVLRDRAGRRRRAARRPGATTSGSSYMSRASRGRWRRRPAWRSVRVAQEAVTNARKHAAGARGHRRPCLRRRRASS